MSSREDEENQLKAIASDADVALMVPISPSAKLNVSISQEWSKDNESVDHQPSQDDPVDPSQVYGHAPSSASQSLDEAQFVEAKPEPPARPQVALPDHLPDSAANGSEEMIVEFSVFSSQGEPLTQPKVFSPPLPKERLRSPKERVIAPFEGPKRQMAKGVGIHYVYCGEVDGKFGFLSSSSKIPTGHRKVDESRSTRYFGETPEFRRAINMWVKPTCPVSYPMKVRPLTSPGRVRCSSARRVRMDNFWAGDPWSSLGGVPPEFGDKTAKTEQQQVQQPEEEYQPQAEDQQPQAQNDSLAGEQDLEVYLTWLRQKSQSPQVKPQSARILKPGSPLHSTGGTSSFPSDKFGRKRRPSSVADAESRGKPGSRVGIVGGSARMSPRQTPRRPNSRR